MNLKSEKEFFLFKNREMKNSKINLITAALLIIFAVASRLLSHPMNFTPITAVALFSGVYLGGRKLTLLIPVIAMLISDYFIGFHSGMVWVYGSFLIIGGLGLWLKGHKKLSYIAGTTLASSVIFFVITNFGVWAGGSYGYTLAGLGECYTMAIPFFRNTLAGDVFYVSAMFGIYELVSLAVKKLFPEENILKSGN